MSEIHLTIDGMKCQGCVSAVKGKLESINGVDTASVDLDKKSAAVEGQVSAVTLIDALKEINYVATAE